MAATNHQPLQTLGLQEEDVLHVAVHKRLTLLCVPKVPLPRLEVQLG